MICSSEFPVSDPSFFRCESAVDRVLSYDSAEWSSHNEGIGSWIYVLFPKPFIVNETRLMQRLTSTASMKDIELQFDNADTTVVPVSKFKTYLQF